MFWFGDLYSLLLVFGVMLFGLYAQSQVRTNYERYSKYPTAQGITGAQAASLILNQNGLQHIGIERIPGTLTDHYDPRAKVLRLSERVYNGYSIAAVSVAAHEVGHAIQHATGYAALRIRNIIAPTVGFTSRFAFPLLLLGFLFGSLSLVNLGIWFYAFAVFFYVITLPVEFDASRRALIALQDTQIVHGDDVKPARAVLKAAALTYVASALASVVQLVRLLLIRRSIDD